MLRSHNRVNHSIFKDENEISVYQQHKSIKNSSFQPPIKNNTHSKSLKPRSILGDITNRNNNSSKSQSKKENKKHIKQLQIKVASDNIVDVESSFGKSDLDYVNTAIHDDGLKIDYTKVNRTISHLPLTLPGDNYIPEEKFDFSEEENVDNLLDEEDLDIDDFDF